jgi:hypothetical protein
MAVATAVAISIMVGGAGGAAGAAKGVVPDQPEVKEGNLRAMIIKVQMVDINQDFNLIQPVSIMGMSQGFGHCNLGDTMPEESTRVLDTNPKTCIPDQRMDHICGIHTHLMGKGSYHLLHNDLPEGVIELRIWLDIILSSLISKDPLVIWDLATVMRLKSIRNPCPIWELVEGGELEVQVGNSHKVGHGRKFWKGKHSQQNSK